MTVCDPDRIVFFPVCQTTSNRFGVEIDRDH
jgi:hypothetical protein